MKWIRSPWLFWLYRFMPHRLFNLMVNWIMTIKRPRWLVRLIIKKWIAWRGIDMSHFVEREIDSYTNVEEFFLRRLRPGARPFAKEGFMSPVDGNLMAYGILEKDTMLQAKGQSSSVNQMVNSSRYHHPMEDYEGGAYITIFLTPNGYHRIHMPCDATIRSIQWIPGRFFPQNEDAIHYIPRIYERNERAVLCCERNDEARTPFIMVLIAASLVGGIHLTSMTRDEWVGTEVTQCELFKEKGEEIAHFSFGSTIVILFPRHWTQDENGPATASLHSERALQESLLMGVPLVFRHKKP